MYSIYEGMVCVYIHIYIYIHIYCVYIWCKFPRFHEIPNAEKKPEIGKTGVKS